MEKNLSSPLQSKLSPAYIYSKSLNHLKERSPLLSTLLKLTPFKPEETTKTFSNPTAKAKKLQTLFDSLCKSNPLTLFTFGIELEHFYPACKMWLNENPKRRLVIFENDHQKLQATLAKAQGYDLIQNKQIDLLYLKAPQFWDQNSVYLKALLASPFEIANLKNQFKSFKLLKNKLTQLCMDQNATFSEYLYASPLFYKNALHNLLTLKNSYLINPFFNQFINVPAIICGAGPSINQDLSCLQTLQNKALIFAGGRALSILSTFNIEPHFAVGIDPYEMHHHTYSQNYFFELPLIYRARMHFEAVQKAHGPLLYTPKAIGYPLIEWIEKQMGISSPTLEEGLNVVNFSLQLAHIMGCDPIILIGCDLAYQNKTPYSKSIELNQKLPNSGNIDTHDFSIHRGSYTKNVQGETVYTLWKWVEEAKWLAQFAEKNPNRAYLNATLFGLNIDHFQNLSLEKIASKYLVKDYDYRAWIHQIITSQMPLNTQDLKTQRIFSQINSSLKHCHYLLVQILQYLEEDNHHAKLLLLEEELKGETAYQHMLKMIADLFDRGQPCKMNINKKEKNSLLLSMCEEYLLSFKHFFSSKQDII